MMKILSTVLFLTLGLLLLATTSHAQYTESELANPIARDSSYPASSYQSYAKSLEKTLSLLSPEQLSDIFRGAAVATVSSSASAEMSSSAQASAAVQSADLFEMPEHSEALDGFNQCYSYHLSAQKEISKAKALLKKRPKGHPGRERAMEALQDAEANFKKSAQNLDNAQKRLEGIRSQGSKDSKGHHSKKGD